MKNIHISLTEFRNESRVLKEIRSLSSNNIFDEFRVIALGSSDLQNKVVISDRITVYRINLLSRRLPKTLPYQVIKFFEFMVRSFFLIKSEKAHVVNLHTLALLPLGWVLKKLLHVRLVYDAHELETEKNGLVGIKKKASKWIEYKFIQACDLVIVVGEHIADWYVNAYKIDRPLVVKNAPILRVTSKNNLFREKLGILEDQKILLYQGGLMKGRGVQLILDAFKVREKNDVVVVFMGFGELETDVKDAEKIYKNIRFYSGVSPDDVLEYTSSANIGIHLIQNTCLNHYFCMPNKFFEYAMAGLPIIVSDMKEMAATVKNYEFGIVLDDFSVNSINQAVDSLKQQDLNKMSENAYEFASANSWEQQEEIMLQGYRRLLQG